MGNIFYIIFHWLHLVAAISSLGGSICLAMVIFPTLKRLGGDIKATFLETAHSKMMMLVLHSYGLLIVTGFVNLMRVFSKGSVPQVYMGIFGVKLLLAFILFGIGAALFLPSEALKNFQSRKPFWVTVNVLIGIVIVLLSAWLRFEGQYGIPPDTHYREAGKRGAPAEEIIIEVPDSADI